MFEAPSIEEGVSEDDTRINSTKTSVLYQRNDIADKRVFQGKRINDNRLRN